MKLETRHWLAGAALFAAALWGGLLLLQNQAVARERARLEATRPTTITSPARLESGSPGVGLGARYGGLERTHTLGRVRYTTRPSVGGAHASVWQNCGAYTAPVPEETAAHSLEHGALWLTYRPNLDAASLEQLQAMAREPGVIVSPYPGQDASVIATMWGAQLWLESVDEARINAFARDARGRAPEPNGPCAGGTGRPLALKGAS